MRITTDKLDVFLSKYGFYICVDIKCIVFMFGIRRVYVYWSNVKKLKHD